MILAFLVVNGIYDYCICFYFFEGGLSKWRAGGLSSLFFIISAPLFVLMIHVSMLASRLGPFGEKRSIFES